VESGVRRGAGIDDVEGLVQTIAERFGGIDVLVAVAGGTSDGPPSTKPCHRTEGTS
jgi:NAD(P)-dependent dehydrogenase (short-subunit alcohol dehydrogenase family)